MNIIKLNAENGRELKETLKKRQTNSFPEIEKKVADIEKKEAAKKAETEKKANNKKLTGLKK